MRVSDFRHNFSLRLLYAGFYRVERWWNYQSVVSPFSRLFLITKGQATVSMNGQQHLLKAGNLFLIPAYVLHSYECDDFMEHYYICFFHEMAGYSDFSKCLSDELQLPAKDLDYVLIERLITLNKGKYLPATDPKKYDNSRDNLMSNEPWHTGFATQIESNGILLQLFSRFITDAYQLLPAKNNTYGKFDRVVSYIHTNLHQHISVAELAAIMCNTPDHFSRTFKKILGISPCEYIQLKRMERAQNYLLTTPMAIKEIAEMVGIPNLSQFSRLFSVYNHVSPRKYRNTHQKEKIDEGFPSNSNIGVKPNH